MLLLRPVLMSCVFENDAIELRQVNILGLRIVCERYGIFSFGTLAEFWNLLVFVTIVVVGFGEPIS